MAILTHATFARNLGSIARRGLLCCKSTGKRAAVWLVRGADAAWAAMHVVGRHGGRIENVVVLEVEVPQSWLRRHRAGLFYVVQDVPPERIRGISAFRRLAAVPT
jgi:hypothetical protein